jgi:tetratricopeptide (TPR) repeat protein
VSPEQDAIWLVKSGEKIIGPFSTQEVTDRLKQREIVVIDEIACHLGHWRFVREELAFAKVVAEMGLNSLNNHEDTQIQSELFELDGTPTAPIADDFISANESRVVHEVNHWDLQTKPRMVRQSSSQDSPQGRTRGTEQVESHLQSQLDVVDCPSSRIGARIVGFIAVVISLGLLLVSLFVFVVKPHLSVPKSAVKAPSEVLQDALSLIMRDGQTVAGKRMLEALVVEVQGNLEKPLGSVKQGEVLAPVVRTDVRADIWAARGLAEIVGEDFAAAESILKNGLLEFPKHSTIVYNLGIAQFLSGQLSEAMESFSQLSSSTPNEANYANETSETIEGVNLSAMMLARTLISKGGGNSFEQAIKVLLPATKSHRDFFQESLLLTSYAEMQVGHREQALAKARQLLEADPFQTEEYNHNLIFFATEVGWQKLLPLCEQMYGKYKSPITQALQGFCLTKVGRVSEARDLLLDLTSHRHELSTDADFTSLSHALDAYIFIKMGQDEDARAALRVSMKDSSSQLARILAGRTCSNLKDYSCAKEIWQSLATVSPHLPIAEVGTAIVAVNEGKKAEANRILDKLLAASPRYSPARKLRTELMK